MKQNTILVLFAYCIVILTSSNTTIYAQTFESSNLPIVLIETDPGTNGVSQEIPDDPRVLGTMTIINRPDNARNFVTDATTEEFVDYQGRISIETRGSSSQTLPKKPYGFSTRSDDDSKNDNVKLLGMPKENDWILNSFAFDDSMMRDFISYQIAREMGQYATRLVYCEVVINGDYRGLYALSEKIKQDSDRVNISKLSEDDLTFPDITGGYIIKNDKSNGDPIAWQSTDATWYHHDPDPEDIVDAQSAYIESVVGNFTRVRSSSNIATGFPSIIDVPTFIDYMLLAEIASNVDSYSISTFYHKDKRGKLRAGPVWDYNLTFGNDLFSSGFNRSFTDVWQFDNGDNVGARFWKALFNNPEYRCYLNKRFAEMTIDGAPLSFTYISDLIDSTKETIDEAVVRENQRWNTIRDFDGELRNIKSWLRQRITWMKDNLGSSANCTNVTVPSLAITKIHYNPKETDEFPDSDEQEFFEVQNTGDSTVDLTGIYFSKLGLSYQFPAGSELASGSRIRIAANASVFEKIHGQMPFGEFSRDLSNKEQHIVLADAFGNLIDEVTYKDKSPWPKAADGDGPWLEVIDSSKDNADPDNWRSSNIATLDIITIEESQAQSFKMYPNPASSTLYLSSKSIIKKAQIVNLTGQILFNQDLNLTTTEIPVDRLADGLYIIKLTMNVTNKEIVQQFVKSGK